MKRPSKKVWKISYKMIFTSIVSARNLGSAVHKAFKRYGIQKPRTDHETGGWLGVSGVIVNSRS